LQIAEVSATYRIIARTIIFIGLSLLIFISAIILLSITNPFVYFFLLILPFFFAGIVYSQLYKLFAEHSFLLYASDLAGAAIGSVMSIFILDYLGASNGVLFLSLLIFCSVLIIGYSRIKRGRLIGSNLVLILLAVLLIKNGDVDLLGRIPIGDFPEKDFYYVYEDAKNFSQFEESRWSINGRSDLVGYTNQNEVKQLFIDGSAGSQMYCFNGNVKSPGELLGNLLIRHSTAIPFLFLTESEKNSMLVIGPGGGKEILTGLIEGVQNITGVEVNPDFVGIVKKYSSFNGGIYTNFPNIDIQVAEGRHFVKQSKQMYDLIVMALPSTEQLQSIDNIASNENFLLTVEALKDYLNILTPEGQLIFTVHNRWELVRLIVTAFYAFDETGVNNQVALNHFIVLGQEYAPTLVIKKNEFSTSEIAHIENVNKDIPKVLPYITYLPYNWDAVDNSIENSLLKTIKVNRISLADYIKNDRFDISPVRDDSPYFYKVNRGVPDDYLRLLVAIGIVGVFFVVIPALKIKPTKKQKSERHILFLSLFVFISIGIGFMILEVSLFQKFILYLGLPTLSLSILLGSLLVGMGTGSYFGKKFYSDNLIKRLKIASLLIVIAGIILFIFYPYILSELLAHSRILRSIVCFFMLLPFGFFLGILFPTCLQLLRRHKVEKYIPWMYGVNGIMSVLGSILAVVLSMVFGFTVSFFVGLSLYFIIFLFLLLSPYKMQNKYM
jgi:hypothetical protein